VAAQLPQVMPASSSRACASPLPIAAAQSVCVSVDVLSCVRDVMDGLRTEQRADAKDASKDTGPSRSEKSGELEGKDGGMDGGKRRETRCMAMGDWCKRCPQLQCEE